ncbi:MAG: glycosyl hydrolase [Calditrichaeota bacterium]|nr:glycosyl hydrolase [Calditrichota bacterium]
MVQLFILALITGLIHSQPQFISAKNVPDELLSVVNWRSIGPYRGGRSAAVTGVSGKRDLYYFGSTGGGVWRSEDGGSTWSNISDGYFGGSIGAVAVSDYDNNIIYVGGGEKTVRGNVSYGYGIWKSDNAGESWTQMGLKKSRHITRIRIHPRNPEIVYAAVLGDLYQSSEERGVYRSLDGGKNWKRILFANSDAGAVDLTMDPSNSKVLYASTWNVRRTPYSFSSGGPGSALWKSTDGGDHWEELTDNKGLPDGVKGIIGVTVSPVNQKRVWALIEAEKGGLFRSDDSGKTWEKVNDDRSLRQRAWYYTRIYADTKDENGVYVLNVGFHKSDDGGKTFSRIRTQHGDHHDLWIDPLDPQRMIIGDDGGAQVSYNGGKQWSTYHNQATAQFYRVVTDNHFPYRIYGAQQDNSTVRISHRSDGRYITEDDWEDTAGGESAHIAVDPLDNDIVYGGSYDGYLTRYNHRTQQSQAVNVWPDNPMGHGAEGMKYRFQWNFPIFFSPHNPKKLYTASNQLHVSYNGGQSWQIISPDLTTNDPKKLGSSGGPITKDNTSIEYYCTIFAATESTLEKDLIWTGSDDGLVYVTRDGGKNWKNVTPKNMPKFVMINSIDVSPFDKGKVYIAGTRYKLGDYQPYLYKSNDYGESWEKITDGIAAEHFTRVLRADPKRKGLLYTGTESGMYISFDDGQSWKSFQLNLPIVPITDLTIKDDNLIAATQGRSFWMIDDLTVLHQLKPELKNKLFHLFEPKPSYRMSGSQAEPNLEYGQNHVAGVSFYYYLNDLPDKDDVVKIEILEEDGKLIESYATDAKENKYKLKLDDKKKHLFSWDMRYPDAKTFKGMILWWATTSGPKAIPGTYQARMIFNNDTITRNFGIIADPRADATPDDYKAQFDYLISVRDKLSETHQAIIDIRSLSDQMSAYKKRLDDKNDGHKAILDSIKSISTAIETIEKALYQTQNKSGQDPLNFPIRLNNKLGHTASIANVGNNRPTEQLYAVRDEISILIDAELKKWYTIKDQSLKQLNELIRQEKIDAIVLESD